MWISYVDVFGCLFGLFGCLIALWIAAKQRKQLDQLKTIGGEQKQQIESLATIGGEQKQQIESLTTISRGTEDIARKLDADNYRQEIVEKFFYLGEKAHNFKCLLPGVWTVRPLPSILSGDYHAIHVLQTLLGREHLELSFQSPDGEEEKDGLTGNAIFLCSPQTNPALRRLAPALQVGKSRPVPCPKFGDLDLPCWFADDMSIGPSSKITKKIWICKINDSLESPSEADYRTVIPNQKHVPSFGIQKDYAIVMRLSVSGRKVFVIAGIHQYGTWIGGEFLNRLAKESDDSMSHGQKEAFLQAKDVLAVLWGNFNTKLLCVENLGIHEDCIWVRGAEQWESLRPPR